MAEVPTAPVAAGSLIAGYTVARASGVRQLGALPLALGAGWCARRWRRAAGTPVAAALLSIYVGAFGGSHPLAKKIGAWPSVLTVAAVSAGASWALSDRRARRR